MRARVAAGAESAAVAGCRFVVKAGAVECVAGDVGTGIGAAIRGGEELGQGLGVGLCVGDGLLVGVGVGVGLGVGVGVCDGEGVGEVGDGVALGVGDVGDGEGVGDADDGPGPGEGSPTQQRRQRGRTPPSRRRGDREWSLAACVRGGGWQPLIWDVGASFWKSCLQGDRRARTSLHEPPEAD